MSWQGYYNMKIKNLQATSFIDIGFKLIIKTFFFTIHKKQQVYSILYEHIFHDNLVSIPLPIRP